MLSLYGSDIPTVLLYCRQISLRIWFTFVFSNTFLFWFFSYFWLSLLISFFYRSFLLSNAIFSTILCCLCFLCFFVFFLHPDSDLANTNHLKITKSSSLILISWALLNELTSHFGRSTGKRICTIFCFTSYTLTKCISFKTVLVRVNNSKKLSPRVE